MAPRSINTGDSPPVDPTDPQTSMGVTDALMAQVALIQMIGDSIGVVSTMMESFSNDYQAASASKVSDLGKINVDIQGLKPEDKDYATKVSQKMNDYNMKSSEWDVKINALQAQIQGLQSHVTNLSQSQTSLMEQIKALQNFFQVN